MSRSVFPENSFRKSSFCMTSPGQATLSEVIRQTRGVWAEWGWRAGLRLGQGSLCPLARPNQPALYFRFSLVVTYPMRMSSRHTGGRSLMLMLLEDVGRGGWEGQPFTLLCSLLGHLPEGRGRRHWLLRTTGERSFMTGNVCLFGFF